MSVFNFMQLLQCHRRVNSDGSLHKERTRIDQKLTPTERAVRFDYTNEQVTSSFFFKEEEWEFRRALTYSDELRGP